MTESRQHPTLATVARAAGVAVSTASLVFAGKGPVSAATKQKVLDAATELGFHGPDPRARSLRNGRSGVVGVVVQTSVISAFRDPVNVGMVDGAAEVLGEAGAGVLLLTDAPHARRVFEDAPMDAAVLTGCSPWATELLGSLRRRRVPTVLVGSRPRRGSPAVDVDNPAASRELAQHLYRLGHRRAATVTLALDTDDAPAVDADRLAAATADTAAERLQAFWDVFPNGRALAATDSTVEEGERIGRMLLDVPEPPTAVVAQSDLLAVGVLRAADALGLAVPDRLSVTGFDGIDTSALDPRPLTTMRQPMQQKGRDAASAVLRMLDGARPRSVLLDCEFVPGATAAPADCAAQHH
ncbi:LacI family DNA-binding transcriptional regulator [Nakamurella aerolata]|uniref:LacI family DNA-binding transcriptional regulator n=1 Tax=Nakamurella aerolata TaxID=1656892 RepID=A0A849AL64_9ACTN|nr:LacI family DNA-binding transcriptional regulator [Nakamurella aerolata]NNG37562.1 LacI family DNA-binding transcriptional regulator [Nakamurella aerolata]